MYWEVQSDGTVKAGGKTYTRQAFAKQFSSIEWKNPVTGSTVYGMKALKVGADGNARFTGRGFKQVKASESPEAAKSKYEKKAAKKVIKEMNKKGVGAKMTGKTPKSPTPTGGRTRIGGLGTGRGGFGGGINWSTK